MGGGGEDESENERIPDQVKCRWTMIDDYKSFDKIRQEGEQNLKRWHLRGAVSMGYERNGSQPLSRTTPQPQPHLPLTASQQTFVYIYCSCPIRVKDRSCFFGSRLLMAVFCRLWVVIILWICYNILQLAEARIYIFWYERDNGHPILEVWLWEKLRTENTNSCRLQLIWESTLHFSKNSKMGKMGKNILNRSDRLEWNSVCCIRNKINTTEYSVKSTDTYMLSIYIRACFNVFG